MKSSVEQIRERFDREVDRFSNLETGQSATVDAPLALELIAEAAAATTPAARRLLDVGCGAGNYTLKLLQRLPRLDVTLLDLSRPMLERAEERIRGAAGGTVRILQADIRQAEFQDSSFDIILAAAVLHHLRTDAEWEAVFRKFYRLLSPGGSVWIFDLVDSEMPDVGECIRRRYGQYLEKLGGKDYRERVFAYIEQEDTPRSLPYQLGLLRQVGFTATEVLHKHACFAAFGAVKAQTSA